MQRLGNSGRFVHVSARIPESRRQELVSEANRQGINFNALVNRVLNKYLEFDMLSEHEHSITLDRRIFSPILDRMTEEDMKNLGKRLGPRLTRETLEFFDVEFTLDGLVSRYLEPMGRYSGRFRFNSTSRGLGLKGVLEHDYGRKWSVFLAEYTSGIVKSILGTEPRIEVEDDLVKIRFDGSMGI